MFRQLLECGIDLAGILQAFPEVQGIVEIDVEHDEWCAVHLRGMDDWTCMKRAYAVKHAGRGGTSLDAVITIGHHRPSQFGPTVHIRQTRSEEHTSELQSLMRISYAVFCLNKKT